VTFSIFFLFSDVVMESQTSSTDHHAAAASAGSSGGEDLHRQVGNLLNLNVSNDDWG